MKLLIHGTLAAVLLAAAPVWAHDGHGHWKHGYPRYGRHFEHKHDGRYHDWRRPARVERVYVYEPYPVTSPAPGIHVIFPDVYLPWPR